MVDRKSKIKKKRKKVSGESEQRWLNSWPPQLWLFQCLRCRNHQNVCSCLLLAFRFTERLKCKCVCEGREGSLPPCQYFPFPPFSISSAFHREFQSGSLQIPHNATSQAISAKLQTTAAGWRRVGSTWSQWTQPLHIHWQPLSPEAPAPCLWTPHKYIETETLENCFLSKWMFQSQQIDRRWKKQRCYVVYIRLGAVSWIRY